VEDEVGSVVDVIVAPLPDDVVVVVVVVVDEEWP
jgi:hypothetical protein